MLHAQTSHRRKLVEFLQATENEIAIDTIAFGLAGRRPGEAGFFPRPAKWINGVGRWRWVYRLAWRVAAILWRGGGAALFFLYELVRLWRSSKVPGDDSALLSPNGYFLGLSSRAGDLVRPPAIEDVPACWLTLPWAPVQEPPEGCRRFDMLRLLSAADLWDCYRLAVSATRALAKGKNAPWVLQTYTALRWFAVRAALEKLRGRFVMAEHFDRWAVLVDSVVRANKRGRSRTDRQDCPLVLVQHGEVGGLSPEAWRSEFYATLRRKLGSVTMLYAFDMESATIFRTSLLTPACAETVQVRFYKPRISLRPVPKTDRCRVLFVGHPHCEALHVHLLGVLSSEYALDVRYKPHPLAAMSPAMSRHEWQIVTDKTGFPEADLLISYPSTLVTEYSAWNIPAVVHPLDQEVASSQELLERIRRELDSIMGQGRRTTPVSRAQLSGGAK